MLKTLLTFALLALVIVPVCSFPDQDSDNEITYPYALYKGYPISPNDVQFLRNLAINSASSSRPPLFLTPIGQQKTAYFLLSENNYKQIADRIQRQHIPIRKVDVVNLKSAEVDNSFHKPAEFPPKHIIPGGLYKPGYVISSPRVTNLGEWGNWTQCPKGMFVVGMKLKTDRDQSTGDNTAVNAIELLCSPLHQTQGTGIRSLEGDFGVWGQLFFCHFNSQVVGFELRSEPNQGADHTAGNNLRIYCNSAALKMVEGDGESFGSWTGPQMCLPNQAVVGFRTQVEPNQGTGDDTALNNVDMQCVDVPQ